MHADAFDLPPLCLLEFQFPSILSPHMICDCGY